MSNVPFLWERNQHEVRRLQKKVELFRSDLKSRLMEIDRMQIEISRLPMHQCPICGLINQSSQAGKASNSGRDMAELKSDTFTTDTDAGHAATGYRVKKTVCEHSQTIEHTDISQEDACGKQEIHGHTKSKELKQNNDKIEHLSKRWHARVLNKAPPVSKQRKMLPKFVSDIVAANKFKKQLFYSRHEQPSAVTHTQRTLSKASLVEKHDVNSTLTAFPFSNHSQVAPSKPCKPQGEQKIEQTRMKIRTKVVRNYLLQDVYKRLSETKTAIAKGNVEPKDHSQSGDFTGDMVRTLEKCRYLRFPKYFKNENTREDTELDITKVDIV